MAHTFSMHAPLFSTITLFTEIIISAIVYYTLFLGYKRNTFPTKLAFFALIYEAIFNISYMARRVPDHAKVATIEPGYIIALAIVHGVLSLIMFLALILFFILAYRSYKKEKNFFRDHKKLTYTFIFFWTFSIVSGILFYFFEYGI